MTMDLKRISKINSKTEFHPLKNYDIPSSEVKLCYDKISNAVSKNRIKYSDWIISSSARRESLFKLHFLEVIYSFTEINYYSWINYSLVKHLGTKTL